MSQLIVYYAHPGHKFSHANAEMARAASQITGITYVDLYRDYPRFDIDADVEQQRLLEHDVVLFQFPFFWYSTPSILKEWQDLVLEHGWAYGHEGTALRGKIALNAVTTGGRETAYRPDGYNGRTVRELLAPLEQTARLCGMTYLAPFVAHGTHAMTTDGMTRHAEDYQRLLAAIRDDRIDIEAASDPELPWVNLDLNRLIRAED